MKCFICNTESKLLGNIEGYIKDTYFDIYECPNCDVSFSDPQFSDGKIYNLIYKNPELVPGYDRYIVYRNNVLKNKDPLKYLAKSEYMYKAINDYLDKDKVKSKRILEVGCGMGYLTYSLNKSGHDCIGLDLSIDAINKAKETFTEYKDKYIADDFFNIKNQKYDVICMLELIEHVSDPVNFINHAMSLLNDNGFLYISTPQKEVKPKSFIWGGELPEVHLSYFSDKSILEMCKPYKVKFLRNYLYNIFNYGVWIKDNKNFITVSTFNKQGELINSVNNKEQKTLIKSIKSFLDKHRILRTLIKNLIFLFYKNKRFNYKHNDIMAFIVKK